MVGHEWAVDLLRDHIAQGQARHAYLFTGPRGVGRRTLALQVAQAINCIRPPIPGEPCRSCRACTHIESMQHPDLIVVQAEKEGGTLKVEQVRDLQRSLYLHPYEACFRVALLLRCEEAHVSAMNALLKTLEEPPQQVVLLLTAESPEQVLPTVVSRCEVLRLRAAPVEQVAHWLEARWAVETHQARLLAHISDGRPGYALRLAQEPDLMNKRNTALEDLERLLAAGRIERFGYAEPLKNVGRKPELKVLYYNRLVIWLSFWRDVLLHASGSVIPITNLDHADTIRRLGDRLGLQTAHRTVSAIETALNYLDRNVNTRLIVEMLLLDLPQG